MLDKIAEIDSSEVQERMGVPDGHLHLTRSWPRSPDQLGLEYVASDGQHISGQWFGELRQLIKVTQDTSKTSERPNTQVVAIPESGILLQSGGADRRLTGLASLLSRPRASLITHRPERRAVVELGDSRKRRFAKVVRPKYVNKVVDRGCLLKEFCDGRFDVPELLDWDRNTGVTIWSELNGISLYSMVTAASNNGIETAAMFQKSDLHRDRDPLVAASRATGKALRAFHDTPISCDVPRHYAHNEIGVLRKWLSRLRILRTEFYTRCYPHFDKVATGLLKNQSRHVLLHRDFYDKQVFVSREGNVGFLDFDTLAVGEAAIDLANALVHMELRVLQGRCSQERGTNASRALVEGYHPGRDMRDRLPDYSDASRLRLACVYSFRPQESVTVAALLDRIGNQTIGYDFLPDR